MTTLLGAHMSISGGMHCAIERGESISCSAIQVFTKNNTRWSAKDFTETDIAKYKKALAASGVRSVVAHDCYLINLAAQDPEAWEKSCVAFQDEMKRCHELGITHLVFHPGSHGGAGEEAGLKRVASAINRLLSENPYPDVIPTFETTAGQGNSLGRRFDEFARLLELIDKREKIAFCVDTCHIFAAGYDISTEEGYEKTFHEFDRLIGVDKIAAFHVNDSKKGLGSRVDRHDQIGKGEIGETPFRCLMRDTRFVSVPKVLETPKGEDMAEDVVNLVLLRSFLP